MKRILVLLIVSLLWASSAFAVLTVQYATDGKIDVDRLPTLSFFQETDPDSPILGQIWWNNSTAQLKVAGALGVYAFNATSLVAWDTTPTAFSFTDVENATTNSTYTSAPITVAGVNHPAAISVSGAASAKYSINNATATAANGTVASGDEVRAVVTSSASDATAVNATVTIGGVSDAYSVTTAAGESGSLEGLPDDFSSNTLTSYTQLHGSNSVAYDSINARVKGGVENDIQGAYYNTSADGYYYVSGLMSYSATASLCPSLVVNCNGSGASSTGFYFRSEPTKVFISKFTTNLASTAVTELEHGGGKTRSGNNVMRVEVRGSEMKVFIDWNSDGDFVDADEYIGVVNNTSYSGGFGGVRFYSNTAWVDNFDMGGL